MLSFTAEVNIAAPQCPLRDASFRALRVNAWACQFRHCKR